MTEQEIDSAAIHLRPALGTELSLLQAVALIDLICWSVVELPGIGILDPPVREPMGREDAAQIVAAVVSEDDHIHYKASYDAWGRCFSKEEFDTERTHLQKRLELAGVTFRE